MLTRPLLSCADLAWIVISRFVLLDSLLLFFTFTTVYCLACFNNQQRRCVAPTLFVSSRLASLEQRQVAYPREASTDSRGPVQAVRGGLVGLAHADGHLDRLRLLVRPPSPSLRSSSGQSLTPSDEPHSVKWVGMFVTALVGIYTVEDLWNKFGDLRMSYVSRAVPSPSFPRERV